MSIHANSFRAALRVRVGQFPSYIGYPYGQDKFEEIRPLTKDERAQLATWRTQAKIDQLMREANRKELVMMWLSLAALVVLYCITDIALLYWLG